MWAMSLHVVRAQWSRIVFMQTNREDVGTRYFEVLIPVPNTKATAEKYATPYKTYFHELAASRQKLRGRLEADGFRHHVFFA
jgi:type I restriction enzyme M protein